MKIGTVSFLCCVIVIFEEVVHVGEALRLQCPSITIKNGKARRRRERGRFMTFTCNSGYSLAGEKHSTCSHGKWDPSPAKCIRATCQRQASPLTHGFIYPSHGGAALHFFCEPEYKLKGPQHIYCDGTKWDNNSPICLPSKEEPKLRCDFETEDMCGWTHDLNHDFDWTRENYNTPSGQIGTGPSWDHTKGEGEDGHYMYIESSSRNENDTARLISPIYDKPVGEICFEFFYHMYGRTTGSLRVYLKKTSESWTLDPEKAFFELSGNQGNHWYRSIRWLGAVDEDFQIIIEGVRGPGYVSDIAIDDVNIIKDCSKDAELEDIDTTTPETITATELMAVVDSCRDRCGTIENLTLDQSRVTCDCDDDCFDNNRCCPDFFDFCASESTTMFMGNDIDQQPITTWTYHTSQRTTQTTTPSTTTARTITSPSTTTSRFVPSSTTARYIPPTTTIRPSSTTTPRPTTTKRSTTITARPITAVKPTIVFKTPPTTLKIAFKIPATTTTTAKPTNKKTLKPGREIENDVLELPVPKDNDEGLFLLTTSPPDDYMSKEYLSEEDLSTEKEFMRHINESVPLFSIKTAESGGSNVFIIIIATAGLVLLVSVVAFAVIHRWRDPRNRMSFGGGFNGTTSQSDVRYLTHDDMIDLSLPKEYDDL